LKKILNSQKNQSNLIETSNENPISIPNASPTRSRSFISSTDSPMKEKIKRNNLENTIKKKQIFESNNNELRETVRNFMETVENWESNNEIYELGGDEKGIGDVKVWNNVKVEGIPSFSNLNARNENCIHNYKVEKLNTLDSMFKNEKVNRSSPNNEDNKQKIKNGVMVYYDSSEMEKDLNGQNFYFEKINLFQREKNMENKGKIRVVNVS
jgi:hypothetical protein